MATLFESESCGRCGGSGSYSWNSRHGSTCYGCSGKGVRLTKRGSAAAAYLRSLLMVEARTIVVGDLVEVSQVNFGDMSVSSKFKRVTEVWAGPAIESGAYSPGFEQAPVVVVTTADGTRSHHAPETLVRKGFTKEEKAPLIERALAYQATLTKLGKPVKAKA